MESKSILIKEEFDLINKLGEVWNDFFKLEELHPSDRDEFLKFIHGAQNILMARPVKREFKSK